MFKKNKYRQPHPLSIRNYIILEIGFLSEVLQLSLVIALKKKNPRDIKQLISGLLICSIPTKTHDGVSWKGRIRMAFSILIFKPDLSLS